MTELSHQRDAVPIGSVWYRRSPGPGSSAHTGPAHVVVRNDGGAVLVIDTRGGQVTSTADDVAYHYVRGYGDMVEQSLATAEREACEWEQHAANIRRGIEAFREALDA
jgi:hypothetical protein